MTEYCLTVVDTSGIQNYVFGTNNLRQNVGASYLADCATRQWAVDAIPGSHNVIDLDKSDGAFKAQRIEGGEIDAEVAYAGGGNILLIFKHAGLAKEFTRRLTRRLASDAPGLRVTVAHREFDWETQPLGGKTGVLQALMQDLARKKNAQSLSAVFPGLAVTVQCAFTGEPAVGVDNDRRPLSAEAKAKLVNEPKAHARLAKLIDFKGYPEPPRDFDELGSSKGEKSYLAVIHSDGNGMGLRVEAIRDQHPDAGQDNRAYIQALRDFSLSVQRAALKALQATVDLLIAEVDPKTERIRDVVHLNNHKLPFRPIVFGGDDVTFVCDGRLGLSLARCYIQAYASQKLADGQKAHCRAGVAIVHSHYPFARAYSLAEELCASAKSYLQASETPLSAMDWHYATAGVLHELKEIRSREYRTSEGDLLMRPLRVTEEEGDWRTWSNYVRTVTEFQSGAWAGKHNKIKALRSALRAGEYSTRNFLSLNSLKRLPEMEHAPRENQVAWWSGRCAYFDAVEAVDLFVPLGEGGQP